jgi:glyoxylase I family protein
MKFSLTKQLGASALFAAFLFVGGGTSHLQTGQAMAQQKTHNGIRFNNLALSVANIDKSITWYSELFGFKLTKRDFFKPVSAQVAFLERDDVRLELLQVEGAYRIADLDVPPPDHLKRLGYKAIVFDVPDLVGFSEMLKIKNVTILWANQPLTDDGLRSTLIRDPDGNLINIFGQR